MNSNWCQQCLQVSLGNTSIPLKPSYHTLFLNDFHRSLTRCIYHSTVTLFKGMKTVIQTIQEITKPDNWKLQIFSKTWNKTMFSTLPLLTHIAEIRQNVNIFKTLNKFQHLLNSASSPVYPLERWKGVRRHYTFGITYERIFVSVKWILPHWVDKQSLQRVQRSYLNYSSV